MTLTAYPRRLLRVTAAVLALGMSALATGCAASTPDETNNALQTVSQAAGGGSDYLSMYVAQDAGLAEANGLELPYKTFSLGAEATQAVIAGDFDIAANAELSLVNLAAQGADFIIPAVIATSPRELKIVVQDDIDSASDLAGKKIALQEGSIAQYAFEQYREIHDLGGDKLQVVNVAVADQVVAFARGDIDGFVGFEPNVSNALTTMDGKAKLLDGLEEGYGVRIFLISTRSWAEENSTALIDYMKTLIDASDWIEANEDQAAEIGSSVMGVPAESIKEQRDSYGTSWDLYLDTAAVDSLKKVADWAAESGIISEAPDMSKLVDSSYLKQIDPKRVRL